MTEINPSDVLFAGRGKSVVNWYRCGLPAQELGCDWVGYYRAPPEVVVITGNQFTVDWEKYKVIFLQQPSGPQWFDHIHNLRDLGIKVIYEVDDYLHGVQMQYDHERRDDYSDEYLQDHVECMEACDGMTVTNEYLAEQYGPHVDHKVWICRNGIDLGRYEVTPPKRENHITIGWQGGTGHDRAVKPWLDVVGDLMDTHKNLVFVNIGHPVAQSLARRHPGSVIHLPFGPVETFPAAMCNIDINLAPAGDTPFFYGKSDLRWLEASALGIPSVVDYRHYKTPKVHYVWHPPTEGDWPDPGGWADAHGRDLEGNPPQSTAWPVNGEDEESIYYALKWLIDNPDSREVYGKTAQRYVREERSIEQTALDWVCAIEEVTE